VSTATSAKHKNKAAFIFVPEPEDETHTVITFRNSIYRRVNEMAALLRDFAGLQKRRSRHHPHVP